MLFRFGFGIKSMREQKWFSDWDLQYHDVNEGVEIVYNDIIIKTIVTIYGESKKSFRHMCKGNV